MEPINKTIEVETVETAPAVEAAPAPAVEAAPAAPAVEPNKKKKFLTLWNLFCMADTTVAVIVSVAALALMYLYITTPAGIVYLLRHTDVKKGLSTERQSLWTSPTAEAEAQKIKALVALEKIIDLHSK